jgi:hypothetical protein
MGLVIPRSVLNEHQQCSQMNTKKQGNQSPVMCKYDTGRKGFWSQTAMSDET